jgi:hypothetical protein
VQIEIELQVVMILPREGIIITQNVTRPRQGFSLRAESNLNGLPIASLTSTKAVLADGARRRDLVSFQLINKRDAGKISAGQTAYLRGVDPEGLFAD